MVVSIRVGRINLAQPAEPIGTESALAIKGPLFQMFGKVTEHCHNILHGLNEIWYSSRKVQPGSGFRNQLQQSKSPACSLLVNLIDGIFDSLFVTYCEPI